MGDNVNVNQVNVVNPDNINVNESSFSHTDLDLQKKKLIAEEQNIINTDDEVRTVNELIINFDDKDGAELYSMHYSLLSSLFFHLSSFFHLINHVDFRTINLINLLLHLA